MAAVSVPQSLLRAVGDGDEGEVRRILQTGQRALVNTCDRDRNAPLHVAASRANVRVGHPIVWEGVGGVLSTSSPFTQSRNPLLACSLLISITCR